VVIYEPKNMEYIKNWNDVHDGTRVIEDTYNELYELKFEKVDGATDKWPVLYHIGWRYCNNDVVRQKLEKRGLDEPRVVDFDPDCMYDQPWLMETISETV
jgi:hypothetical protein